MGQKSVVRALPFAAVGVGLALGAQSTGNQPNRNGGPLHWRLDSAVSGWRPVHYSVAASARPKRTDSFSKDGRTLCVFLRLPARFALLLDRCAVEPGDHLGGCYNAPFFYSRANRFRTYGTPRRDVFPGGDQETRRPAMATTPSVGLSCSNCGSSPFLLAGEGGVMGADLLGNRGGSTPYVPPGVLGIRGVAPTKKTFFGFPRAASLS